MLPPRQGVCITFCCIFLLGGKSVYICEHLCLLFYMSFLPVTLIDSDHTNMHLECCVFLKLNLVLQAFLVSLRIGFDFECTRIF